MPITMILQTIAQFLDQHERSSSHLLCSNCENVPPKAIPVSQKDIATDDFGIFESVLCHSCGQQQVLHRWPVSIIIVPRWRCGARCRPGMDSTGGQPTRRI